MAYTTIDDPEAHFQVVLYTGNSSTNAITLDGDTNMQPDFVWIKNRSNGASHALQDAVRGNDKSLRTNNTNAEYDNSFFDSFDSDGFTLSTDETDVNTNTHTLVAWCWKANGAGSSDTSGDITSTVSANTTAGFSIFTYTGDGTDGNTVAHGLSVAPKIAIFKSRSAANSWVMFGYPNHPSFAADGSVLELAGDAAMTDSSSKEVSLASTLVTFVDAGGDINTNTATYVGYAFAEVQGFSKFGSYTGNGNADGPFVYTGFKPAWVFIKRTNGSQSWYLLDNKRNTYNPIDKYLSADNTTADQTLVLVDFVSNGFKCRGTADGFNGSTDEYVYMAFAEAPFVNSEGVPCNAS